MDKSSLNFDQLQQLQKNTYRYTTGLVYLVVFLPAWFMFLYWAVRELGIDVMEGMMLGTATGIFLAKFSDMWQFIWRKS